MMSVQQKKPSTASPQQYSGTVGIIVDGVTPLLLLLLPLTSSHPGEFSRRSLYEFVQ